MLLLDFGAFLGLIDYSTVGRVSQATRQRREGVEGRKGNKVVRQGNGSCV